MRKEEKREQQKEGFFWIERLFYFPEHKMERNTRLDAQMHFFFSV
jgi:hypothetical protein